MKRVAQFTLLIVALIVLIIYSAITGSIDIGPIELVKGLVTGNNPDVIVIQDLRFPRIIIAMFAGAMLSVSGTLLQAVMRNPLAEPGIIGISSGAGFMTIFVLFFYPSLYFYAPLLSVIGGAIAFLLVFLLSWKSGLQPLRLILIGVAVNAVFVSFGQLFAANGNGVVQAISVNSSTLSMKTWNDVQIIALYGSIGLILAIIFYRYCNHLGLSDKTLRNLGFNVHIARFLVAAISVLLASIATSIAGMFTFVGLLIPHIGRIIIGTNHKVLIPFSALLGAFLILLADTIGRTIIAPIEIPASIIMAVVGGPFLIFLLRKSERIYGN